MEKSKHFVYQQRINSVIRLLVGILSFQFSFSLMPTHSFASDELYPPAEYIGTKLKENDIVFLGTKHKKPVILKFIADLIPTLKGDCVTHIGLEVPSDQQEKIDTFIKTGNGLDTVQFHKQVDCPEYRHLFQVVRESNGPVPVTIDLPYAMHGGDVSRDEWMSKQLMKVLDSGRPMKVFVLVGNNHILKKLEWEDQVHDKHPSIRQYIERKKPEIRMWSIGQLIDVKPDVCDFTKKFGPLQHSVALDLNEKYRGWKLGIGSSMAIKPAECFELVDGVVVY